jgi:hypothetical protein
MTTGKNCGAVDSCISSTLAENCCAPLSTNASVYWERDNARSIAATSRSTSSQQPRRLSSRSNALGRTTSLPSARPVTTKTDKVLTSRAALTAVTTVPTPLARYWVSVFNAVSAMCATSPAANPRSTACRSKQFAALRGRGRCSSPRVAPSDCFQLGRATPAS